MSCMFCNNFKGLNKECLKGVMIETSYESFDCDYYDYNKELRIKEE